MNNYDELEDTIGNVGGEEQQEPQSLGKLQHINQGKQELTDEEEASKSAFLNRSKFTPETDSYSIREGWIPIDRESLGIRDRFYPADWQFRVKPATVEAIKNWSSIDEENIAVTNNVFNEIMKSCVSIETPTGRLSWGKINSWDRFWFILKVREYTFSKGEAALDYEEDCPECGATLKFELNSDGLVYEFPDEEVIEKHWQRDRKVWEIDPKEYGIDAPVVTLYTPTLEKDEAILQWAYAQAQLNKQISEPFMRFLPWLISKSSKDPQVFEKFVKEANKVFKSWDTDMFTFMDEVLRNITINPSEQLKQTCYNCGEEVRTTVRFPNGIKHIFAVQNKHRKFGSK